MKFSLLVSVLLLSPLLARENPFFTPNDSKANKVTSNIPDTKPLLGTLNYPLPDQARILKEVTFTIQNLDGSIESRKMEIDQSIDWHRPISITQGSHVSSAQSATANNTSTADFGFIRFDSKGKHLTIKTSDPLVRHFVLSDPSRIVLDFKRNVTFKEEKKILNAAPYISVTLGNHAKFIRATITLDGRYSYSLNKTGELISITCK